MTIKELIELLQKYPPNLSLTFFDELDRSTTRFYLELALVTQEDGLTELPEFFITVDFTEDY